MAQHLENLSEPGGLSGVPVGYLVQALAEDPSLTARIAAPPASHTNGQFHWASLHGEVPQLPQVTAVAGGGPHSTVRARGRQVGPGTNHPTVVILLNAARLQTALVGQQLFAIQCTFHNFRLPTSSSAIDLACTKSEAEPK